ncbi:MAG TPA: energy transducer TonB [Candidatus Binatia bacterium]|nr:energy transducer TonB [Candidatus Binatia bacterium]
MKCRVATPLLDGSTGFISGSGGVVSLRKLCAWLGALVVAVAIWANLGLAQDGSNEITRRAKTRVEPTYPDLARKMNITGTVKVEVVVSPNGTVKDAKVVGGHPVLAGAALEAVKKWRFEPAASESTGVVDFKFEPHQ